MSFLSLYRGGNSLCVLFSTLPSSTREGRAWCIKFTLQIPNSIKQTGLHAAEQTPRHIRIVNCPRSLAVGK